MNTRVEVHPGSSLYICLISIHGLIRGHNLELGRDSDTGGQTLYVVELAQALSQLPAVGRVDLVTRKVVDPRVDDDYAQTVEVLNDRCRIVRIDAGPEEYIAKEQLWDHLDGFADNLALYFQEQGRVPNILHSHYADAGYVGSLLSQRFGVGLIHTGHSLGRVKLNRFLDSGLSNEEIESRFNMTRRIHAEEMTLATAQRVITSTRQEIHEQYEFYDYYQPEQMLVIPPGTDLTKFQPSEPDDLKSGLFLMLTRHLKESYKPLVLALSRPDKRKNICALVEAFGRSDELQRLANLVIIAGNRDDIEELEEGAQEVFQDLLIAIDRYDLYGRVALPKHHERSQVPLIYRCAAATGGVFVNPALTEPFGLTLIEAAASGLPIVATEDGGPRDIIANCDNGLLVDPLNTEAIADALLRLLKDNDLWQQCRKQGLSGVREHYSWQSHANRYLEQIMPLARCRKAPKHQPVVLTSGSYRDRVFVSDLDLSMIGDATALQQLVSLLRQHRSNTLQVLATGRRLDSALKLLKQHRIPEPHVLIASSGTEIYYTPGLVADIGWSRHIAYLWTPRLIRSLLSDMPGLKLQPRSEQSRFKLSYYIDPDLIDVEDIQSLLHQHEQSVHVQVAFGQFMDILPLRASKGLALRYLPALKNIPLERVFVAGGSGADEALMRGNTLAAVVANRHDEELSGLIDLERIYFSKQPYAAGILEALHFYDFFGNCRDPREKGAE